MPIKRYKAEQIVTLLRQIEVGIANGKTTPQVCKEAEITVQTYYRWRKEYGGLKLDQAKLRKWFAHDAKRWIEFRKRYREELRAKAELTEQLRELEKTHQTATPIYSTRDERRNQAVVLCAFLQRST
jgi:uncharacterized protein YeaO (DUF488 family)